MVFRRVLLPLAGPGVVAGAVLAFARALGEFGATLMLAGNIPGRTQTMPIAIFSAAEGGDMHAALVWVVLIVILSLAIVRLLNLEKKDKQSLRVPNRICPRPLTFLLSYLQQLFLIKKANPPAHWRLILRGALRTLRCA